jgi:hypothetical protein
VNAKDLDHLTIRVPEVIWELGDPEQSTTSGVTVTTRPIYYRRPGATETRRVGAIDPDYADELMAVLLQARR